MSSRFRVPKKLSTQALSQQFPRRAMGLGLLVLGAPPIQHVLGNPQIPRHLGHGVGELPHQPYGLDLKFLGIPTSRFD